MAPAQPIIVTGAGGFVGRALCERLGSVQALSMSAADWQARASGLAFDAATVFHLAARVHHEGLGSEDEYRRDNAGKTRELAQMAAARGARAFLFVSSIKVHGEESTRAFTEEDAPAPQDAYGRSKLEAEDALRDIASRGSAMRIEIVRAPLVLGAGARGNLGTLFRWVDSPWPLPFASCRAPRSFIHVEDLVDALVSCAKDRATASPRTLLVAHREPFHAAALIGSLRRLVGRAPRLFPMPPSLLEAAGALTGKRETLQRLTRPLVANPVKAERELVWLARRGLEESLQSLAQGYIGARR